MFFAITKTIVFSVLIQNSSLNLKFFVVFLKVLGFGALARLKLPSEKNEQLWTFNDPVDIQ
jgi:hypothetical protein